MSKKKQPQSNIGRYLAELEKKENIVTTQKKETKQPKKSKK